LFLLIAPALLALLAWLVEGTTLTPAHVRDCWIDGKITAWRILSVVLVQIVLWGLVSGFLGPSILPHLPAFFTTGWRLGITYFTAALIQWFALFMVLGFAWVLLRATLRTALYAIGGSFKDQQRIRSLDQELQEENTSQGREHRL
jgi:hypothetical protein